MLSKGDHFISIGPKDMYFKKEFKFRYDKFLCISWAKYFYKHKTLSPRKYRIVVINLKACCSFVNENRYSRRNLFGTNN